MQFCHIQLYFEERKEDRGVSLKSYPKSAVNGAWNKIEYSRSNINLVLSKYIALLDELFTVATHLQYLLVTDLSDRHVRVAELLL